MIFLEEAKYKKGIPNDPYTQPKELIEDSDKPFKMLKRMGFKPDYERMKTDTQAEQPGGQIAALVERYVDLLLTKAQDKPLDFRRVFKKCINEVLKLYHQRLINTQAGQSGEVDEELITDLKIFENYCKDCIPEWYEKIKRARQLLARQPQKQVTREWIEKELNAHLRLEDEALRDYVHVIADIIVEIFTEFGIEVVEEQDQPPMDKETAGDMKYHELKDEDRLDEFGRRKL